MPLTASTHRLSDWPSLLPLCAVCVAASYGYMFSNPSENATSIWELWDADREDGSMNSRNLIMFTSIGSWLWRYCAGIQLDEHSGSLLRLEPLLPSPELGLDIHSMDASYVSLRGLIRVAWSRTQSHTREAAHPVDDQPGRATPTSFGFDRLSVHITVPHNVAARVRIPHPHPSQTTELRRLWEFDAAEGSASTSARDSRRLLTVERVATGGLSGTSESTASEPRSAGVRSVRWLADERVLELSLSSGSFGFDLTFAAASSQSTALTTAAATTPADALHARILSATK